MVPALATDYQEVRVPDVALLQNPILNLYSYNTLVHALKNAGGVNAWNMECAKA